MAAAKKGSVSFETAGRQKGEDEAFPRPPKPRAKSLHQARPPQDRLLPVRMQKGCGFACFGSASAISFF